MSNFKVSDLFIYPAKSMRYLTLNSTAVDRFGFHNDRRWMLVDSDGVFLSQRKQPRMCLIKTSFINSQLELQAPGMPAIIVPEMLNAETIQVKVWNDVCSAYDCGKDVAQWFSEYLSINCRLVFFPEFEQRQVDLDYARPEEYTAFSDGFPVLLISQGSLDDLNSRLELPVPMIRFRPNIVVSGCEAFAEDEWKEIQIGGLVLRVVKPCSRCGIPSINTYTAEKSKEPLQTLSSYRKRNNKIFFGQNLVSNGTGRIDLGMEVNVLK